MADDISRGYKPATGSSAEILLRSTHSEMTPLAFPVGYHDLHPDVSMNYQMNRFYGAVGELECHFAPDTCAAARVAESPIATPSSECGEWDGRASRPKQSGRAMGSPEGMHVTGTRTAFEFLQAFKKFETADVSASITQDVLLLAGSEDHYIPIEQWYDQTRMLTNARSITARLFTRDESAQNHCQSGNQGLALKTIVNWLDETPLGDASPSSHGVGGTA